MYKKIIFFIFFIINSQNHALSMDNKALQMIRTENIIQCECTTNLRLKIICSKWKEVKEELLHQNELDVFARESIEDIFSDVHANNKCKPSQNLKIRNVLSQRLFDRHGKKIL